MLGAALVGGGGGGRAVAGATLVVLGPGVLETVESPAPQPASITAPTDAAKTHFTSAHRTVIVSAEPAGGAAGRNGAGI
jgi:hypothetical protein